MSNIVKSVAVVDERPRVQKTLADVIEEELGNRPVIKKEMFHYRENPYADQTLVLPDKQGYIDELNRIKVEIAQAREELRRLGGRIDEAVMEAEQPKEPAAEIEEEPHDHGARAEEMLNEAKASIDAMMLDARAESERLAEEAKSKGYLEGFEQGFAQAADEFRAANEPRIKELEALLEQLSNYREEMIAQNERDLMSLVISVAKKVIGHEIKGDPRSVVTMLYKSLDENRREEDIRITVSPELMPAEGKVSAEIRKLIAQTAPSALIYVDENAEEGTCYIETGKGITDLSVNTQLENIGKLLTEE